MNTSENITLVDNNNIISSEIEIAEKLNAIFSNMVKVKEELLCDVSNINNPVERAIQKYKNHPTIQMIKETFDSNETFSFDLFLSDTIFIEVVLKKLHTLMMYQPRLLKHMLICFYFFI